MGEQVSEDFGSPLAQRQRRERLGLDLDGLAREAGLPLASVRAYEAGTVVDHDVAAAVEEALQRIESA